MKRVIFLSTLLMIFIACQSPITNDTESPVDQPLTEDNQSENKQVPCDYLCNTTNTITANPNNPYDIVGQEHNRLLCKFYNEHVVNNPNYTMNDFQNMLATEYTLPPSFSAKNYSKNVLKHIKDEELDKLIDQNSDATNRPLLYSLIYEIENYDATNLCVIISNIKNLEAQALSNHNPANIKQFLMACSVARYSLSYWNPYLQQSGSQGTRLFKNFWKKLFIGVADLAGAIAGTSGGFVGTIIGASSASVAANSLWGLWD